MWVETAQGDSAVSYTHLDVYKRQALEDYALDIILGKGPSARSIRLDLAHFTPVSYTHLTSEMEVFFELCPCKLIAVTGSDGKSTTTTLVAKLLEAQGYTCLLYTSRCV